MIRKASILSAALVGAFIALTPTAASAGIPIPCTGDRLVKIADLPEKFVMAGVEDLSRESLPKEKLQLSYLNKWCVTGKFVASLADGSGYYDLPQDMLPVIAILAKLESVPQAPSFWASAWHNKGTFWVEWMWLAFMALVSGAATKNKLLHGTFTHPAVIEQREAAATAAGAAQVSRAAPAPAARAATPSARPAAARVARALQPSGGATPAFGKR